ncbi:MAG: GIY-YIG nuclease family protein [Candidatus Aenigmarchaeota archaeon]|nr:GIY-YIG nuclease family protein [Candidatus Aenigmarchaeota archaeon]
MFYVYVLKCKDGSFYTGYTNDVEKRVKKHNTGTASKYTRSRLPANLVKSFSFATQKEAMRAELKFKKIKAISRM